MATDQIGDKVPSHEVAPLVPEGSVTPFLLDVFFCEIDGVPSVQMSKAALDVLIEEAKKAGQKEQVGDVTKQVSENVPTFTDISNEEFRTYHFPDGSTYSITFPVKLNIKRKPEGDSHRLIDSDNVSHYVKAGWNAITWRAKDGGPGYSF
jgi:hypothetical protein